MFCFGVVNERGQLEHCAFGGGTYEGNNERIEIDNGIMPVMPEVMPEGWYYTIIEEEDLITALSDPAIARYSSDREVIRQMLRDNDGRYFDAWKIREDIVLEKDPIRTIRGVDKNKSNPHKDRLFASKVKARKIKAKVNEISGEIIEDVENYDKIVEETRVKNKLIEDEMERKKGMTSEEYLLELQNKIRGELKNEILQEITNDMKKEIKNELKEELRKSLIASGYSGLFTND